MIFNDFTRVGKSPKINFYRFYQTGKVPKNQFLSILPEWESPQKSIFIDFTRVGKSSKINFYRFSPLEYYTFFILLRCHNINYYYKMCKKKKIKHIDFLSAVKKADREREIKTHGKLISTRPERIVKSKKIYSRKGNRNKFDDGFLFLCPKTLNFLTHTIF